MTGMEAGKAMSSESFGWTMSVKVDRIAAYRAAHLEVWPEMQRAITTAGLRRSRMYLYGNRVFGYAEADNVAAALERLAATEANRRWQALIDSMVDHRSNGTFRPIEEIFRLD